ncbi:thioredoxin domain-containing protein [Fluviicola sp.]|jgi:thiol-disulfide isomerase/thioredoxin|uniref:thioredoxin family protein n=1 Tax=Fluviicola sp. TaxID=1917219 RepID=UPI0028392917|nr:thioredoxin domain-containing protein [Fluviicola sp.]MDR0800985.1 thioredoxin family protein [Fluviicola sp.]
MKLTALALTALLSTWSFGQITFEHGTLKEAIEKAKQAKKPLFVDVYATWCGPCKQMAATAFIDPEVSTFYNASFVSLKLDGEKNDGPEVMSKYGITAYPTLLYFDASGNLAGKVVGALQAKQLLLKGQEIASPEANPVFIARKEYLKSKKKQEDLKAFIKVLSDNQHDSLQKYATEYYQKFPKLNLADPVELTVFKVAEHDYRSPLSVQYLNDEKNQADKDQYMSKINDYFITTYQQAKTANDFEIMKSMAVELYPYLQKCNIPDLPSIDQYLEYVKGQFDK